MIATLGRLYLAFLVFVGPVAFADPITETATGIQLDSKWKTEVYQYAKQHAKHPSWGISHSERGYQMTLEIAKREAIEVDKDALFAASFLHDLGALASFAQPGVEHAVRSAELAEPLLRAWGFPMEKWPTVKEMILGHMFDAKHPSEMAALAFRDADILDFLGAVGVARILAVTLEPGPLYSLNLSSPLGVIRTFRQELPKALSLRSSQRIATERIEGMDSFLKNIDAEALSGRAY